MWRLGLAKRCRLGLARAFSESAGYKMLPIYLQELHKTLFRSLPESELDADLGRVQRLHKTFSAAGSDPHLPPTGP